MPSVLFVCTANRFRSPLAAAIFRKALTEEVGARTSPWNIGDSGDWEVGSAGTWAIPGEPVLPEVLDVGKQLGFDLSHHRSVQVDAQMLSMYDLVLVMEDGHREALQSEYPDLRERIYLLSHVVEFGTHGIPDAHSSLQEVIGVGAGLNELIRRGLRYICVLAIAMHNKRVTA